MNKLHGIVSRVLGIPPDRVTSELSKESTSEWDSFNHLMLISEIEKEMNVEVPMTQMDHIKTVADLENIIKTHGTK